MDTHTHTHARAHTHTHTHTHTISNYVDAREWVLSNAISALARALTSLTPEAAMDVFPDSVPGI